MSLVSRAEEAVIAGAALVGVQNALGLIDGLALGDICDFGEGF